MVCIASVGAAFIFFLLLIKKVMSSKKQNKKAGLDPLIPSLLAYFK